MFDIPRIYHPATEALGQTQNGELFRRLGQQFGLTEDQAKSAVDDLVPALTRSLRANTTSKAGLSSLMEALATGDHQKYVDQDNLFTNDAAREDGNAILGHILGSREVSRAVAQRASFGTDIGVAILRKMLPYIATLLMGMLSKKGMGGGTISMPQPSGGGGGWFGGGRNDNFDDVLQDLSNTTRQSAGVDSNIAPSDQFNNPFGRMSDAIQESNGLPGSIGGRVRDAVGGMLGGKSGGWMGWIMSFIVYKYGWRIAKALLGRFLGR